MLGKCPKSPERCPYSHDADPPKIMELCKFYLLERCAKKEKCLYLHKGFPCKYWHTGHRCLDTAESCKFSHDNLNDITRNILLKHLEAAPKEILGDFPRLTREAATTLVFQTEAKHKGWLDDESKSVQEDFQKKLGDTVIEEAKVILIDKEDFPMIFDVLTDFFFRNKFLLEKPAGVTRLRMKKQKLGPWPLRRHQTRPF